jgi:DNA polymerase III psi subunit
MSYDEILELPLKVFTIYNKNISRIRAEEDTRLIRVFAAAGPNASGELLKDTIDNLHIELGTIVKLDYEKPVEADTDAFAKLASMQNKVG